jgi:hypothetical protein
MRQNHSKKSKRPTRHETTFVGELQRFSDPPGGAPLDDLKVRARKRRGRPAGRHKPAPADKNGTLPAK